MLEESESFMEEMVQVRTVLRSLVSTAGKARKSVGGR